MTCLTPDIFKVFAFFNIPSILLVKTFKRQSSLLAMPTQAYALA